MENILGYLIEKYACKCVNYIVLTKPLHVYLGASTPVNVLIIELIDIEFFYIRTIASVTMKHF